MSLTVFRKSYASIPMFILTIENPVFGEDGARRWFETQQYAIKRIGAISKAEAIECEYRQLPGKIIVSVPKTDPDYQKANDLKKEYDALRQLNISEATYVEDGKVGESYVGAIIDVAGQATFHPTKYVDIHYLFIENIHINTDDYT